MSTPAYRIHVVCTGNICRSPMGEFLLQEAFDDAGLGDLVAVDSSGTTAWEEGNPADPRTLAALARNGHHAITDRSHVARVFDRTWFGDLDLVLAADEGHYATLRRLAPTPGDRDKVAMFRSFEPGLPVGRQSMDDPWYGDDAAFDRTYAEISAAVPGVVEFVRAALDVPGPDAPPVPER
ncbi:low molecular weight protein-tyrosine-phosphatase [Kribbia dieselivorans]|uniref:low molecular weight protein-tyrosine-phosphatase n=1 Tax=Kribbia dieselivorans TaxID=331526 RepID=UPI0008398E69|nr:low molecular weight protein-tyrosine-phosphatase [Kribbia dieselivorans]